MITRSEQLESKLPAPDMSTSPSGLNQAEQPRQSHPATVQAFNVARAVLAYIDGLPATPERFNLLTIRNAVGQGLGEAVLSIWSQCHSDASAVLQSNVDAVVAQVNAYAAAHGIHPTGSCMGDCHVLEKMHCAQNLLLSKQLLSSQLETYILCLLWAQVGRFSMLDGSENSQS
ncbi:hypothetical protein WJX77_002052 [Trebouxia sp. C0004]